MASSSEPPLQSSINHFYLKNQMLSFSWPSFIYYLFHFKISRLIFLAILGCILYIHNSGNYIVNLLFQIFNVRTYFEYCNIETGDINKMDNWISTFITTGIDLSDDVSHLLTFIEVATSLRTHKINFLCIVRALKYRNN